MGTCDYSDKTSRLPDEPNIPPVSVIPDNNPVGLTTDDPRFDVVLGGFLIENTGFDYGNPTIEIIDKDREAPNGVVKQW